MPYGIMNIVNIGLDNGLLSAGTKPLPETKVDLSERCSDIHLRVILQDIPQPSIIKTTLIIN